jgi:hypothetical protein
MIIVVRGIIFLLTIENVDTLAIAAVAIKTPETGETVRPIEAESCMGKIR